MSEILRHKDTLECLRICLIIDHNHGPQKGYTFNNNLHLKELIKLKTCLLLKELSIDLCILQNHVVQDDLVPGDVFFADIVEGCKNLEFVELVNVCVDQELMEKVRSLPNLNRVNFRTQ